MNFVKNLVPFKRILQYFFKRFLGKYCSIDLELANFNGDEVIFRDLELNCKVSVSHQRNNIKDAQRNYQRTNPSEIHQVLYRGGKDQLLDRH